MLLNEAVSLKLAELLQEKDMTQYQLYMKSGVPKSTIGNVVNCSYDSVKRGLCMRCAEGLVSVSVSSFNPTLFEEDNLDPQKMAPELL